MTTLALGQRTVNHTFKSLSNPFISWKAVLVTGLAMVAMLLVLYVVSIDGLTKGAYTLKNYDKQVSTLSDENRVLQMNLAKTDELAQIVDQAQAAGFEKASGIKYVEVFSGSLAKAQ